MLQKIIDDIEKENLMEAIRLAEWGKFPYIAIINTNPDDEPSQRYIKAKCSKLGAYGIKTEVIEVDSPLKLKAHIIGLNDNAEITGIILQLPLGADFKEPGQNYLDLIRPSKDIDKLHSCWVYSKNPEDLPLTALGIYKLINRIKLKNSDGEEIDPKNILMIGNGITTNRRLFSYMFDEGKYQCRIANSKSDKTDLMKSVYWADIVVSATGQAESLICANKVVISPTIARTEEGFRSDLRESHRGMNDTHKVLGSVGKLTVSELIRRAYGM